MGVIGEGQPTLTDGVVSLRPLRAGDSQLLRDLLPPPDSDERQRRFVIDYDGHPAGTCAIDPGLSETVGVLTWALLEAHRGRGLATRAVRTLCDWGLSAKDRGGLGLTRLEARIDLTNSPALRVATRSGLRREGVERRIEAGEEPDRVTEYAVFARLCTDPPLNDPASFRTLLNSFLPRKRAIAQMLIRDTDDRVLLCQLTYKQDWDLPGGVVEVGESPHVGAQREVAEELGLQVPTGELLLTDWLPAWSGWDDAICLVFNGGRHHPGIADTIVHQEREIRSARFCTPGQVAELALDFTAKRITAALARLDGEGPAFTHSGHPPAG